MKKYKVNVNGNWYEIALELVDENDIKTSAAPAEKKEEAPVQAAPVQASAGAENILSPMPGTILDVKVSAGAAVKKGDILVILEAMKMENEIRAPRDGKIASVGVTKGASVQSGTVLCVLD